jgi:hypothetical protein
MDVTNAGKLEVAQAKLARSMLVALRRVLGVGGVGTKCLYTTWEFTMQPQFSTPLPSTSRLRPMNNLLDAMQYNISRT